MKKFLIVMFPVIVMVAVAALCIFSYLLGTGQWKFKNKLNIEPVANVSEPKEDEIILTKNELPRLDASAIAQPIMNALIRDFAHDPSISETGLGYTDTDEALNRLLNNEVDAVITTYPSEDVFTLAQAKGIELDIVPIVKEPMVFFVNNKNPIDSLSVADIQQIYNGQVNTWSYFGGEDVKILAFQKPDGSTTQKEMETAIMKGLAMIDAVMDVFTDKVYGEVDDLVANYDNSENAIGYAFLTEAKLLYDFEEGIDNGAKMLKIDDKAPNYDNVKNGEYPMVTHFYLITDKANESERLQIFKEAVLSERGKNAIKEAGYIDN